MYSWDAHSQCYRVRRTVVSVVPFKTPSLFESGMLPWSFFLYKRFCSSDSLWIKHPNSGSCPSLNSFILQEEYFPLLQIKFCPFATQSSPSSTASSHTYWLTGFLLLDSREPFVSHSIIKTPCSMVPLKWCSQTALTSLCLSRLSILELGIYIPWDSSSTNIHLTLPGDILRKKKINQNHRLWHQQSHILFLSVLSGMLIFSS